MVGYLLFSYLGHSWVPRFIFLGRQRFCRHSHRDGATVDLDIKEGSPHGWLQYDDARDAKGYLYSPPWKDVALIMPGAQQFAVQLCNFCIEK
jgi:hypothetical protein